MRGLRGGKFWFDWTKGVYPIPEWVELEPVATKGIDGCCCMLWCWVYVVENGNEKTGEDWGKAEFNDEDEDMDELCVSFLDDGVDGELIFWDEWFELVETLLLDRLSLWFVSFTAE